MLTVVPTPIGNLGDITRRAIETLQTVDLLLAEDTRVAGRLLKHLQINKPIWSYHIHNEHRSIEKILERLKAGDQVALISDAGTPGISDPGYLIVKACISAEIKIQCLPGPTAFVPALVMSGLPAHRFHFEGFLPHKKGRKTRWEYLASLPTTMIIYESPHRIHRTINEAVSYFPLDRPVCLCREISKLHEEVFRGSLQDLARWAKSKTKIKGEIVLLFGGASKSDM